MARARSCKLACTFSSEAVVGCFSATSFTTASSSGYWWGEPHHNESATRSGPHGDSRGRHAGRAAPLFEFAWLTRLLSQPREFAIRLSSVFILDAWHADERARLSVASPPGLERPQQALGIDPVGFDATGSPVDFRLAGSMMR